MKRIKLNGKYAVGEHAYALVDDQDFEYLNQWKWKAKPNRGGEGVYAERNVRVGGVNKVARMHRVVLGLGWGDEEEADHLNHDTLDNRRSNLRAVSHQANIANAKTVEVSGVCSACDLSFTREVMARSAYRIKRCEYCETNDIRKDRKQACSVSFPSCDLCGKRFAARKSFARYCGRACRPAARSKGAA